MARTHRTADRTRDGRAFEGDRRRRWYSVESRPARKACIRTIRRAEARYIHDADFEGTLDPRHVGTEGWLTH